MMAEPITIAVVIPLYNKGPHIERALESVFSQTVPPDEIIVVDDCSTDDGVAKTLAYGDPRIRVIYRTTPGPGGYAARNAGIEASTSEWIAFLDADDSWAPHAIEQARRMIATGTDKVSCVFSGYFRDYGDGVLHPSIFSHVSKEIGDRYLSLSDFVDVWLETGQSPMWTSAVVARRSSLFAAGLFPAGKCNRGGDKDTWLRLLSVGDAIGAPSPIATYHRDSVNMVTRSVNTNQRPYLCGTLADLARGRSPALARRLEQLINWEMLSHARDAWRERQRINPALFQGFIVRRNPQGFAALNLLARAPDWALALSYGLKDLKARLRKKRVRYT